MSTFITRAMRQPATAGPTPPRPKRSGGAGVDQGPAPDRSKPTAVAARGRTSPIRAWRAADADPSPTPQQGFGGGSIATAGPRYPFGGDGGSGARRSTTERAARMRAVEQAWKDERARQAELDDD